MNQPAIETDRPERVFQPTPGRGPRNSTLLLPALVLLVVLIVLPDAGARLLWVAFAGAFAGLCLLLVRRDARKRVHVLRLSPSGLHHDPLVRTCGTSAIPWSQIRTLDIFRGTYSQIPGRGPRWLRIHLHDGPLRHRIVTPISERIFGGDINILLDFDTNPDFILSEAKAFHARYR